MKISFITSLYNCLPLTRTMLASLQETLPAGLDCEIILVDDGSTDGTRAWLETLGAPVRVLLNERNLGFAAANNRAVAAATGEIIFLLNNDLVLLPGWFEPMLGAFSLCPDLGVIGNVQRAVKGGGLDHRGVRFDFLGQPRHDQRRLVFGARRAYSPYPAVTAACCALSRETFLLAGGFDESYRNGYEDIDLCVRLARKGRRHYVANRSVVRHHVSASPERRSLDPENFKLFLQRWGPPSEGPLAPSSRLHGLSYLQRYWSRPWRYNGPKLLLALARIISNRRCDGLRERWQIKGGTG